MGFVEVIFAFRECGSSFSAVVSHVGLCNDSRLRVAFFFSVAVDHVLDVAEHLLLFVGFLEGFVGFAADGTRLLGLGRLLFEDDGAQLIFKFNNLRVDFIPFAFSLSALFPPILLLLIEFLNFLLVFLHLRFYLFVFVLGLL